MGELRTLRPRGWRPVIPAADGEPGEDVERTPTSGAQFEFVAEHGALEPGERFAELLEIDFARRPSMSAEERASWSWWPTEADLRRQLEREHQEADAYAQEHRSRPPAQR
jgi:hypothetical protein